MAENKKFGYIRVSSRDQNPDRQIERFKSLGINERDIYIDKMSGKDTNRPKYQSLKEQLREGDTLVITSLDRLSRNYDDLRNEWKYITQDVKANIEVLDSPILNTANQAEGRIGEVIRQIVFELLSYMAETHRKIIRESQREGTDIAKKAGKFAKANKIQAPEGFKKLFNEAAKGNMTHIEAMDKLDLNKTTYYRIAKELGLKTTKRITPDNTGRKRKKKGH